MKKLIPLAVLLITPLVQVFAQEGKLKNVQDGAVWAPTVKVDGNLKEWDDTFQAYNKTTKIFYTVCNDDKYLYFVVKSIDPANTNKITAGGISLVINTDGKKKDKDAFSITYPIIARTPRGQGGNRGGGGGRGNGGGFGGGQNGGRRAPDSATVAAQHKQNIENAKEIRVLGFKNITDTLISIYNEFSIKAAMGYDPLGNFDYELAVPFKELNIDPSNAKELAYHVTLNGVQIPQNFDRQNQNGFGGDNGGANGGINAGGGGAAGGGRGGAAPAGGGRGGRGGAPGAPGAGGGGGNPRFDNLDMFSPTDFWGKYTLAKK